MKTLAISCATLALASSTAAADEITETIESALKAYQDGDSRTRWKIWLMRHNS